MKVYWTVYLVGLIISFFVQLYMSKKYNVKSIGLYRHVDRKHKWIEIIVHIIMLFLLIFASFKYSLAGAFFVLIIDWTVIAFIRAYMEYKKGVKEDKKGPYHLVIGICNLLILLGLVISLLNLE